MLVLVGEGRDADVEDSLVSSSSVNWLLSSAGGSLTLVGWVISTGLIGDSSVGASIVIISMSLSMWVKRKDCVGRMVISPSVIAPMVTLVVALPIIKGVSPFPPWRNSLQAPYWMWPEANSPESHPVHCALPWGDRDPE